MDATGHIDLKQLTDTLLDNLRSNNADPDARQAWESERDKHAEAVRLPGEIPKPPALNPDGSEKDEAPVENRESAEAWLSIPDDVLDLLE